MDRCAVRLIEWAECWGDDFGVDAAESFGSEVWKYKESRDCPATEARDLCADIESLLWLTDGGDLFRSLFSYMTSLLAAGQFVRAMHVCIVLREMCYMGRAGA